MDVKLCQCSCITDHDGAETCSGCLEKMTVTQAVQFVMDFSVAMASAEFDQKCYKYFALITGESNET